MKFVALLSGGKDSCYNAELCLRYQHELVCLANLYPSDESVEEINSFMFQTAAHQVIPMLAICFNKPLYRHKVTCKAINMNLRYTPPSKQCNNSYKNDNDEVEDLYELLCEILVIYPDIQGVSCGAIVSNYQRYRIENICQRLKLFPLTYLWYRSRYELIHEINDSGLEAILVKVAGAGLDPYKHLGKTLKSLYPTLIHLNHKYGLDLCGEGGEYESLVVDMKLFKKYRLNIMKSQVIVDDEDASVGNLSITSCELQLKENHDDSDDNMEYLHPALILLQTLRVIYEKIDVNCENHVDNHVIQRDVTVNTVSTCDYRVKRQLASQLHMNLDGLMQTRGLTYLSLSSQPDLQSDVIPTPALQLHLIFTELTELLTDFDCSLDDVVYIHLYLSEMTLFHEINVEYMKWFHENPPSRSCIALPLHITHTTHVDVMVDAIIYAKSYTSVQSDQTYSRDVLHIQSQSLWAPMCIGPYSQANSILSSIVFIAGQIPLDPATMTLWTYPTESSERLSVDIDESDDLSTREDDETSLENEEVMTKDSLVSDHVRELIYQAILSLRHVARILNSCYHHRNYNNASIKTCDLSSYGLSCIVYIPANRRRELCRDSVTASHTKTVRLCDDVDESISNLSYEYLSRVIQQLIHINVNESHSQSLDATGDSEGDLDDSSDDSNRLNEEFYDSFPVNVIEVSSLPRDAPIEIEFISCLPFLPSTDLDLHISSMKQSLELVIHVDSSTDPVELLDGNRNHSKAHQSDVTSHQSTQQSKLSLDMTTRNIQDEIETWPFWPRNQLRCNSTSSKDISAFTRIVDSSSKKTVSSESKVMRIALDHQYRYCEQCLCSGFIIASFDHDSYQSNAGVSPCQLSAVEMSRIIQEICVEIVKSFHLTSKLSFKSNIHNIRVYLSSLLIKNCRNTWDIRDISGWFELYFNHAYKQQVHALIHVCDETSGVLTEITFENTLKSKETHKNLPDDGNNNMIDEIDIPVIVLPVLGFSSSFSFVSVQYFGLDLLQIDTRKWIAGG